MALVRPATLDRAVRAGDATVLVAELDGERVGFCTAYDGMESMRFGRRVWVEDLAVDPNRRSLGLGKLLLDEGKGWARARGASHLELDSDESRTGAHLRARAAELAVDLLRLRAVVPRSSSDYLD
jgi:GNAT superfamily N-acetyltransferase